MGKYMLAKKHVITDSIVRQRRPRNHFSNNRLDEHINITKADSQYHLNTYGKYRKLKKRQLTCFNPEEIIANNNSICAGIFHSKSLDGMLFKPRWQRLSIAAHSFDGADDGKR